MYFYNVYRLTAATDAWRDPAVFVIGCCGRYAQNSRQLASMQDDYQFGAQTNTQLSATND